LKALTKP